ncbi:uncharacterized protein LOC100905288 [Galendromus occidentalis]|uniref:Uncharacterized protein LOC100905288 n=1 Tax=Galendromus occidentalis TaxID=34638 RepID=A0AAJ6QUA5_9ACAR|nr:uncharacterized protein LOC100905288 [Galendromus occidentalis]
MAAVSTGEEVSLPAGDELANTTPCGASDTDDRKPNNPLEQSRVNRKGGLNQELRERIKQKYQAKTVNLLVRYNKLGSQFADFSNNVAFLSRCANMSMIPKLHRVYNHEVRNTRVVVRILDQCSYKILMADLDHNRRRKYQVRKNRESVEHRLREIMSEEDFDEIQKICAENEEQHFSEVKEKQRREFSELVEEYKINETARYSDH